MWESRLADACLGRGFDASDTVSGDDRSLYLGRQARVIVQVIHELDALNLHAGFPARTSQPGLVPPFEKMQKQDRQSADQLALLGPAHALDFLGDVLDIRLRKFASAQQPGLFVGPGVKIPIIKRPVGSA